MEKVVIGNAELWHGDCLEVLPLLATVAAIITDPPYEAEAHTLQRRTNGSKDFNGQYGRKLTSDPLDFAPITEEEREQSAREFVRLANGWILIFCQAEAVAVWRDRIEDAGGKYKRPMVWVKPDALPQMSGDRPAMGYESIVAAWGGDGRSTWNGGGRRGVFTHNKGEGNHGKNPHPTMKPVSLMNDLVHLFSNPGDTVLDPFMGSGTTGIACMNHSRKFIGIEKKREYFELACERLALAQQQMLLAL